MTIEKLHSGIKISDIVNGQFVMKPKYEKVKTDMLDCKATFMKFGSMRIEYDGLTFSDNGFENSRAVYRIIEEIRG